MHWNEIAGARFYEIYRILPDKSEELVWASTNNYTYIYNMKRTGKEDETILKVVAVLEDMKKSKPGTFRSSGHSIRNQKRISP